MTNPYSGAEGVRPPHAKALTHQSSHGRSDPTQSLIIDGHEYVRRDQALPRRTRRRWLPLIPALLIGSAICIAQVLAPPGYQPITFAGNLVGVFRTGGLAEVNRQELCAKAATEQLDLDKEFALREYKLEMKQWEVMVEKLSGRYSQEKGDLAAAMGQCNLANLFAPELGTLCEAAVATRYGPSMRAVEAELAHIQRQRPEAPEILSPNYKRHLEECETS